MHADMPAACENCATPLQGAYCHVCGQHAANPLRHFAHALEEVFESFWHLDGRVFRTLRDLVVPGRVACNYLAGHRVRYIAPLRLFVILTVLTFFVGQIAATAGSASRDPNAPRSGLVRINNRDDGPGALADAKTVAEVEARLARQVAELREARESAGFVPGARMALDEAEKELRTAAAKRIEALRAGEAGPAAAPSATNQAVEAKPGASAGTAHTAAATPPRAAPAHDPAKASASDAAPARASTRAPASRSAATPRDANATDASMKPSSASASTDDGDADYTNDTRRGLERMAAEMGTLKDPKKRWHETDNPVHVSWIPAFADGWFNQRLANMEHNVERIERGGGAMLAKLLLAAVPPALFVLVPVFALLLRAFYPMTARGYLEHLVVALYSHAAMLLVLLGTFALMLLRVAVPHMLVTVPTYALAIGLWIALPVYLFAMQQRVYRQHWLATAGKYAVLGMVYVMLVSVVALYSLFAALTSGA